MRRFPFPSLALAAALFLPALAPHEAAADRYCGEYRGGYQRDDGRSWGRDQGRWRRYDRRGDRIRYVVVRRPRYVIVRPAYADVFVYHRPRYLVVRPVPVWPTPYGGGVSGRVGIHTRNLSLNFGFAKRTPAYGCDFCDAYFSSYDAWEDHINSCPNRPDGRIMCQRWDDDDLRSCQGEAGRAWSRANYDDDNYQGEDDYDDYDR